MVCSFSLLVKYLSAKYIIEVCVCVLPSAEDLYEIKLNLVKTMGQKFDNNITMKSETCHFNIFSNSTYNILHFVSI